MEVFLVTTALLAAVLVGWATPGVMTQHRIDQAFKRWDLAVQNFTYTMGQVSFAMEGTNVALGEFLAALERAGYEIEDSNRA